MMICMYGAASDHIDDKYIQAVEELGKEMAKRGHELIYGGGGSGLMGACARGVTKAHGKVTGVVPSFMHNIEPIYEHCTSIIKTQTMADRKQIMEENADAFIIVPGGIGTLDEFFQILTLKELHRQEKKIVLLNVDGFFEPTIELINIYKKEGFIRSIVPELFEVASNAQEAIDLIERQ